MDYINYTNPTGVDSPNPPAPLPQSITMFTIAGNTDIAGVTINYDGGSTVSGEDGVYSFVVPAGWSGTVTPSLTGYMFSPENRTYSDFQESLLEENYPPLHVIYLPLVRR